MPTPSRFFKAVAQKWGNVNPDNDQAVEKWFLQDFPKLPKKDLNTILDELIQYNNEKSIDPGKVIYPADIPLPFMKDTIPFKGFLWVNLYKSFIKYIQSLIKK